MRGGDGVDVQLEDLLDADPGPPSRRRTVLLALAGVVTAAALGAGGWYGTGYLRDGDLRAALAALTGGVQQVSARAQRARTAGDLVLLAQEAALVRGRVERARDRLRGDGPGVRELEAQARVLAALAPLATLGNGPLQAWGRARDPLEQALAGERAARAALRRERRGDADRAGRAVAPLGPAVDRAASGLLAGACARELARVRGVLGGARTTADVRAAGEVAGEQAVAVRASARAVGGGVLSRCATVVEAVAGLGALSGASPEAWAPARAALGPSLGGPQVLAHVDAVLAEAVRAERAHRAAVAAAAELRRVDAEVLTAYATAVRGSLAPYAGLDAALVPLLDSLVARRATPADLAAFTTDVTARRAAAAGVSTVPPVQALAAEHTALVQAATAEASAVQAVADALASQAGLPLLPPVPDVAGVVRGLPLGQLVGQRVGATAARVAAAAAWEAAVVRATALVDKRPLPEPPVA